MDGIANGIANGITKQAAVTRTAKMALMASFCLSQASCLFYRWNKGTSRWQKRSSPAHGSSSGSPPNLRGSRHFSGVWVAFTTTTSLRRRQPWRMTGSKSTTFTFENFSAFARGNDDKPSKLTIQKHPTTARGRFEFRGVFRAPFEKCTCCQSNARPNRHEKETSQI